MNKVAMQQISQILVDARKTGVVEGTVGLFSMRHSPIKQGYEQRGKRGQFHWYLGRIKFLFYRDVFK